MRRRLPPLIVIAAVALLVAVTATATPPDPAVYLTDNLTAVVMGLGTEFWAMRRRMMVIESLLEQNKVVNRAAIEAYRPSDAEAAAWNAERDDLIDRVFAVLGRVPTPTGGANPMTKVPPLGPEKR